MNNINIELGNLIKTTRKNKALSQQDLADKSELSKFTIGQIERGNATPSIDTLSKIAASLDCDLQINLNPLKPL